MCMDASGSRRKEKRFVRTLSVAESQRPRKPLYVANIHRCITAPDELRCVCVTATESSRSRIQRPTSTASPDIACPYHSRKPVQMAQPCNAEIRRLGDIDISEEFGIAWSSMTLAPTASILDRRVSSSPSDPICTLVCQVSPATTCRIKRILART